MSIISAATGKLLRRPLRFEEAETNVLRFVLKILGEQLLGIKESTLYTVSLRTGLYLRHAGHFRIGGRRSPPSNHATSDKGLSNQTAKCEASKQKYIQSQATVYTAARPC